jgi:beta-glucuronidase
MVMEHEGGHLPFEAEIDEDVFKSKNHVCVTVAVNNTLTPQTIPQGTVTYHEDTQRLYYFKAAYAKEL